MQIVSGLNRDEQPKLWPLGMCVVRILQVYRWGKIVAEGQYYRLGGSEICRMISECGRPCNHLIGISTPAVVDYDG
jgi:hypothetical protein